jgi:uncharacterized membrane protein YfhO
VALVEPGVLADWGIEPPGTHVGEVIADVSRRQYVVKSDGRCLLVLGEVYYPWWRASVDGQDVDVIRVNHAMVGVPVPAGSHLVRLRLVPVSVWAGGAVSAVGALFCVGLLASIVRRPARDAAPSLTSAVARS